MPNINSMFHSFKRQENVPLRMETNFVWSLIQFSTQDFRRKKANFYLLSKETLTMYENSLSLKTLGMFYSIESKIAILLTSLWSSVEFSSLTLGPGQRWSANILRLSLLYIFFVFLVTSNIRLYQDTISDFITSGIRDNVHVFTHDTD